jgi:hypothetical protein
MMNIWACSDLEQAHQLWVQHWPQNCLFDLWDVRACFQEQFERPPYFIVATEGPRLRGMMALSWLEEECSFGHFPGEVWNGKTWLEQNKIMADSPEVFRNLWEHIPHTTHIRYLTFDSCPWTEPQMVEDEIGFLFYPPQYGYSFQAYRQGFSGKSRKKLRNELSRLEALGVTYRYDSLADIESLLRFNLENFGSQSYFSDARFLKSFKNLAAWMSANKLLRMTTVLIGGQVAAVDMGAVWNNTYTVLAGGTDAKFPGVAKLINLHHLEWSCRQRFTVVDFLCGDFNWKNRFHLTTRPLYQLNKAKPDAHFQVSSVGLRAAHAG